MADLLNVLPTTRPEPTSADVAYWREARAKVGDARVGTVLTVDPEVGVGYLRESSTGEQFAVVKKFVEQTAFDRLKVGATVRFFANNKHAVSALIA